MPPPLYETRFRADELFLVRYRDSLLDMIYRAEFRLELLRKTFSMRD